MHRLNIVRLWIVLSFPSYCWTTPTRMESKLIDTKKEVITIGKFQDEAKRMQPTLDRTADHLEQLKLRKNEANNSHESKTFGIANYAIINEKLERIAKIQSRNSRLINLQMESLTNLEENLNNLINLRQIENVTGLYQQQIVDRLTTIDNKLDKLAAANKNNEKELGTIEDKSLPNNNTTEINSVPSCETLKDTALNSGIYTVERQMEFIWGNASSILCDATTNGGGWTVIQKRGPILGRPLNFTRSWNDYANGFGNLLDEFWLGNEIVHRMTFYNGPHELRIELEDWEGQRVWAQYSNFQLGTREDNYRMKVSGYTGNATDSLSAHDSTLFSTFDRKNDIAPRCCPCTADYGGGWWYYSCFEANLNGDYYNKDEYRLPFRGIIWEHWRGNYSLKRTIMMIRSKLSTIKNMYSN